jgi:hypothetical protein
MLEDEFLPAYDVSDAVAVVVEADAATTWAALMEVDLIELGRHRPLVGVLGALRLLPELIGHLSIRRLLRPLASFREGHPLRRRASC